MSLLELRGMLIEISRLQLFKRKGKESFTRHKIHRLNKLSEIKYYECWQIFSFQIFNSSTWYHLWIIGLGREDIKLRVQSTFTATRLVDSYMYQHIVWCSENNQRQPDIQHILKVLDDIDDIVCIRICIFPYYVVGEKQYVKKVVFKLKLLIKYDLLLL